MILVGSPGTGKPHLASALGRRACEKGYEVRFYRVAHLVEELGVALANGSSSGSTYPSCSHYFLYRKSSFRLANALSKRT